MCKLYEIILLALYLNLWTSVMAGTYEEASAAIVHGDYETALKLLRPLAEAGDAEAQASLGDIYHKYEEFRKAGRNLEKALKWYELAAVQGNIGAQNNLGYMYGQGMGVPRNYVLAVKWYQLAATQGNATAQFNLGLYYQKGWGVPRDWRQALQWFRLAGGQGEPAAQVELGQMYAQGQGVVQDFVQAYTWFNLAAASNRQDVAQVASHKRAAITPMMTIEQLEKGRQMSSEWKPVMPTLPANER